MTGDRDLTMLIGNGLSIAFSDQLLLGSISQEMTLRFTANYTSSDAVAKAMRKVAEHQPTGDPETDFEVQIGAFGGQSDILYHLAKFADLVKNSDPDIANSIQTVRDFVSEVQRRGIGHTLEIIAERSYADYSRRESLETFFDAILSVFQRHVTVANLNYDTLVLAVLADRYRDILSDMAHGQFNAGAVYIGSISFATKRLRLTKDEFMSLDERRLRLLHLHGSLTYWKFGSDDYRKLPVDAVRNPAIWETYRSQNAFVGRPQVVLANQHEKAEHVTRYPYNLAYELAEADFKNASHWLIVGYSFRDICVNGLLGRCWEAREARKNRPAILVVTHGDGLEVETVEDALGWARGSAASNKLRIVRGGAFTLAGSAELNAFVSA
jgi:SIR2-like domain